MILPSKHISQEQSLLGVGAVLLSKLKHPQTTTSLWEKVRSHRSIGTFERFILGLDLLYITGAISIENGMITKEKA